MSNAPALGGVNVVADIDSAGDFEKKHAPFVSVERNGESATILVEVGHSVAHPNDPDHFIQWIEIRTADATLVRFDLSPVATSPRVSVVTSLPPGTPVRVIESCNLHGVWATDATA